MKRIRVPLAKRWQKVVAVVLSLLGLGGAGALYVTLGDGAGEGVQIEIPAAVEPTPVSKSGGDEMKALLKLHQGENPTIRWSSHLAAAAQDVATRLHRAHPKQFPSHKNPHNIDDTILPDRVRATGYKFGKTGENVAQGQTSANEVFEGWMNSDGHRRNIQDREYQDIGCAHVGQWWACVFGWLCAV